MTSVIGCSAGSVSRRNWIMVFILVAILVMLFVADFKNGARIHHEISKQGTVDARAIHYQVVARTKEVANTDGKLRASISTVGAGTADCFKVILYYRAAQDPNGHGDLVFHDEPTDRGAIRCSPQND